MNFKDTRLFPISFYHYNSSLYTSKSLKEPSLLFNDVIIRKIHDDSDDDVKLKQIGIPEKVKSIRNYEKSPISLDVLNQLLMSSYQYGGTHPSAGGFYPIDIWLIVNRVEGMKKGLYYYNVSQSKLNFKKEEVKNNFLSKINSFAYDSPLLMVLVADLSNIINKYGARAYRYCLIEAGHIGQNLYLSSLKLGLGCCAIGGFYDQKIMEQLPLGMEDFPIVIYSFGNRVI